MPILLVNDYFKNTKFSQEIKNKTTIQSSYPGSGYVSKRNKIIISERYVHPHVHGGTVHRRQGMVTTHASPDRLMDKENVIYMYEYTMKYHSAFKKKEILPFATT